MKKPRGTRHRVQEMIFGLAAGACGAAPTHSAPAPTPASAASKPPAEPSGTPTVESRPPAAADVNQICAARLAGARPHEVLCITQESTDLTVQGAGDQGLVRPLLEPQYGRRLMGFRTIRTAADLPFPPVPKGFELGGLASDGKRALLFDDNLRTDHTIIALPKGRSLGKVTLKNVSCVHCGTHDRFFASPDLRFAAHVTAKEQKNASLLSIVHFDVEARFKATRLTVGEHNLPESVGFSNDGAKLALSWANQTMEVWDVRDRRRSNRIETPVGPSQLVFLADGVTVAARYYEGRPDLIDTVKGTRTPLPAVDSLAFERDFVDLVPLSGGRTLLFGQSKGVYLAFDASARRWNGSLHVFSDGTWLARDTDGRVGGPGLAHIVVLTGADKPNPGAERALRASEPELLQRLGLD